MAEAQLARLTEALGQATALPAYLDVQNTLLEGWGDTEVPDKPSYPSAIGDDHSPYEYSVAFGRAGAQLRILCEAQSPTPSLSSNYRAALGLNEVLREKYRVDLRRFEQVRDLFSPHCSLGAFSLWHAVMLSPNRAPDFKLYLNPQIRGRADASRIVCEALDRLGFGAAAGRLMDHLDDVEADGYAFNYFSVDLSSDAQARVKVYVSHPNATAQQLERVFAFAPSHQRGDVVDYCQDILGHVGPFEGKPVSSCFAFVEGADLPKTVTFHLPVAHYVENDALIGDRVGKFLREQGLAEGVLRSVLGSVPSRPLADRAGFQSYASFRREGGAMRLTAYLSPELFSPGRATSGTRRVASSFPPIRAR